MRRRKTGSRGGGERKWKRGNRGGGSKEGAVKRVESGRGGRRGSWREDRMEKEEEE